MRQLICLLLVSSSGFANETPTKHDEHASLKRRDDCGVTGIEKEQALIAKHDLTRIRNKGQLQRFIQDLNLLVRVEDGPGYTLDSSHIGFFAREKDRWLYYHLRPYAWQCLEDLGIEFAVMFNASFRITSMVRDRVYQTRLRAYTKRAVQPWRGSHPTGSAFDISKLRMTKWQLSWMRGYSLALERSGVAQVTEEGSKLEEAVPWGSFHIVVSPDYIGLETATTN